MMRNPPQFAGSALSTILDTALDRMVAPGYSRLGYAIRAQSWDDDDPPDQALHGAVVAVTGASSGIGKAVSMQLAQLGAEVLMLVRNTDKAGLARDDILRSHPDALIRFERCDVSNLDDVRATGQRLTAALPKLDALVHNAGVLPSARSESAQGHEITLATHVLGPVLLTQELLPALARSKRPRIVFVSSGGMYTQGLHPDDPEYRHSEYRGATAYARTKRMQVALLPLMAKQWAHDDVMVAAMHPGWVETPGVQTSLPGFHRAAGAILRTPQQGADTITWLAASERQLPNARFWHDRHIRPQHYLPYTRYHASDVRALWQFVCHTLDL